MPVTSTRTPPEGIPLLVDRGILRAVVAVTGRRAPVVISSLSNRQKPWLAATAVLLLLGERRAAARGLTAVVAAGAGNGVLKSLVDRRRPQTSDSAGRPPSGDPPRSASFPSGHTVTAVAFTIAVTDELRHPLLAATLASAAAAIGLARVAAVRHWPTDIAGSVAIGAVSGVATRRLVPSPRRAAGGREIGGTGPRALRPRCSAPPRP
ncbi:phosphatase PAP2 family protein [Frankia sp. QA3]|uniref:phosphatase PAP2 family protein n=1 Tax=Frankia sp. QA3 TaxID=710111 RepID=UPI000269C123|nr:phosphatase PAP2 family protein [Frankia sp. QA3]EIV92893.1 membrane-associated phospholipid phosphatase [Frankia sp. QA3]